MAKVIRTDYCRRRHLKHRSWSGRFLNVILSPLQEYQLPPMNRVRVRPRPMKREILMLMSHVPYTTDQASCLPCSNYMTTRGTSVRDRIKLMSRSWRPLQVIARRWSHPAETSQSQDLSGMTGRTTRRRLLLLINPRAAAHHRNPHGSRDLRS